jgi:Domain of unknown function (DUF4190)
MATTPPDDQSQGPIPPPSPPPPPQPPPTPPAAGGSGYYSPPTSTTNGLAIASLVSSIAGWVICGIGFILGIVFGSIAKNQIDQSGGTQQGRGLAVAGIIIGWVGIGLGVLVLLIVIIASAASS